MNKAELLNNVFFENAKGDRKSCKMDSVVALFKRYGIDYVPEGLIK